MLKKDVIASLAKISGVKSEELEKAMSGEEEKDIEIKLPHQTFTEDEWNQYEEKIDEEKGERYESGKTAGREMMIKEEKKAEGLEFEGKDFNAFKEYFKEKILKEAKIEPEKQVEELKTDLQKVREELETTQGKLQDEKSKYDSDLESYKVENEVNKILPFDKLSESINADDVPVIIKNRFDFGFHNKKFVIKDKDGEIIKGKTREPVDPKEYVFDFLKERNYISTNGRGDGDGNRNQPLKMTKFSEFEAWCTDKGINVSGAEAQAKLNEITKENNEFDFSA